MSSESLSEYPPKYQSAFPNSKADSNTWAVAEIHKHCKSSWISITMAMRNWFKLIGWYSIHPLEIRGTRWMLVLSWPYLVDYFILDILWILMKSLFPRRQSYEDVIKSIAGSERYEKSVMLMLTMFRYTKPAKRLFNKRVQWMLWLPGIATAFTSSWLGPFRIFSTQTPPIMMQ
jgi:hypothetical protein